MPEQEPPPEHDPRTDYEAARQSAALFDLTTWARVIITGKDRASFLHSFCTNDILQLREGEGCEAFVTNGQARILAYVRVWKGVDALWLDGDPDTAAKVLQHLGRYVISEEVELADASLTHAQMRLAGPRAAEILEQHLSMPVADWRHLSGMNVAGCIVRRNDDLGVPGFDLICSTAEKDKLREELVRRGARAARADAYEWLRIEAGTPEYGQDIDESNLPQEIGREARTISFIKGCYLGQETICRIRDLGHVNRRLMGLILDGEAPAQPGAVVTLAGQEVGRVTSSIRSPRLGRAIALAYLRRGHQAPGTTVEVALTEPTAHGVSGRVSPLPFSVE